MTGAQRTRTRRRPKAGPLDDPPVDTDPLSCPNCGQEATPLDAYCAACGTLFGGREEE